MDDDEAYDPLHQIAAIRSALDAIEQAVQARADATLELDHERWDLYDRAQAWIRANHEHLPHDAIVELLEILGIDGLEAP